MFTGIVREVGEVVRIEPRGSVRALSIRAPEIAASLSPGSSVAVDGACLTAVGTEGGTFEVEVVGTTAERTIAGGYEPGSRVNLEPAIRLGEGLDGHLVQGHVDGLATVLDLRDEGEYRLIDLRIPPFVGRHTILHGSIALNGVSLTVNDLRGEEEVQVAIIPHTWSHTNLSLVSRGDSLNVEGDLIGKYVGRILPFVGDPTREGDRL